MGSIDPLVTGAIARVTISSPTMITGRFEPRIEQLRSLRRCRRWGAESGKQYDY